MNAIYKNVIYEIAIDIRNESYQNFEEMVFNVNHTKFKWDKKTNMARQHDTLINYQIRKQKWWFIFHAHYHKFWIIIMSSDDGLIVDMRKEGITNQ